VVISETIVMNIEHEVKVILKSTTTILSTYVYLQICSRLYLCMCRDIRMYVCKHACMYMIWYVYMNIYV
jgi:hypothetical protein